MSSFLPYDPNPVAARLREKPARLLLFGPSGCGKSTLAEAVARELAAVGVSCRCLGADPGSPAFGPPGAVSLGSWESDTWRILNLEALCTLDGGRFRLPLVAAVERLARQAAAGVLLVDAPGLVRSVAGAELLPGLVEAAGIETVLVLAGPEDRQPLVAELAAIGCEIIRMRPHAQARHPGPKQRARQRTRLWNDYLADAQIRTFEIPADRLLGTPPPLAAAAAWPGRQLALLKEGRTLALGEIMQAAGRECRARLTAVAETPEYFLVRDAGRDRHGLLVTCRPQTNAIRSALPPDLVSPAAPECPRPRPAVRLGDAAGLLVNGVFGDPLLHLRLANRKRSLLFDLGEGVRLPARLAHQVSDVFISHAHLDHIAGFLWLLRSRIGLVATCRLYGPPGITARLANLLNGIHWDRIGEGGPRFTVGELEGERLLVSQLQAGRAEIVRLEERKANEGLLLADSDCTVRAAALDHGGIPVLAYGLALPPKLNVRRERLAAAKLAPGPWLGELKKMVTAGELQNEVTLPDGQRADAAALAAEFLRVTPSRRLAYATDVSDTAENRDRLVRLVRGADVLFCEATFLTVDERLARLSGHLTSRACGEIARAAGVRQLVPFHFSRRYEKREEEVYVELAREVGGLLFFRQGPVGEVPIRR